MSKIVLLDPQLTPHVNFNNFHAEKIFFIFKIVQRLDEERAAAIDQF